MRDAFFGGGTGDPADDDESLFISKTPGETTGEQTSSPNEPTEPHSESSTHKSVRLTPTRRVDAADARAARARARGWSRMD